MSFIFRFCCRSKFKSLGTAVLLLCVINVLIVSVYLLASLVTRNYETMNNPGSGMHIEDPIDGSKRFQVINSGVDSREARNSDSRDSIHVIRSTLFQKQKTSVITTGNRTISLFQFRKGYKTGNPLIDDYGNNNLKSSGELGRGVVLTVADRQKVDKVMEEYRLNVLVSDEIPLNRMVPDSRIQGCDQLSYTSHLPTASVIIPFYNEWFSVLMRTVYSLVNRSPRTLLHEIILVDDASTLDSLKRPLEKYINESFPEGLVKLIRQTERQGLIKARMAGSLRASGRVVIFFDSHMEVNIDWLPPLLTEIARDNHTVAMATLDYIQASTFEYKYNVNYMTRYGWDWRLVFFETFFRQDQIGPKSTSPRPGATMVGAAFAMDRDFFFQLGGYDEGMQVWGGENLEMSWRVWLCGGKLIHVPCSRIGHVPRAQPYSFPGGRWAVEHFNYKRAISVWMGNYSRFVYHTYPDMKTLDVGDISSRVSLKAKLACHDFSWYLDKIWPELNVPDRNVSYWGEVHNKGTNLCLDNNNYLFQAVDKLYLLACSGVLSTQAFSLSTEGLLKTSLQCVVAQGSKVGSLVELEDCIIGSRDRWKYSASGQLVHAQSQLCMDAQESSYPGPKLQKCNHTSKTQLWTFKPFTFS